MAPGDPSLGCWPLSPSRATGAIVLGLAAGGAAPMTTFGEGIRRKFSAAASSPLLLYSLNVWIGFLGPPAHWAEGSLESID